MFKWSPNFFIILVAPPGIISKSTTAGVGIDLLRQVDGIHFGPDSVTWQALTDAFVEAEETIPDIGIQAPITVAASELGTFLDPRNRELIDVLNDLWDGKARPWKRRTRQDGEKEIKGPWLNLVGCTTPGWLEENVPEVVFKGGFMSRTVFVYQEKKRHLSAYLSEKMAADEAAFGKLKRHLINDLRTIANIKGEYKLTPEATAWGTEWYERHWTERNPHGLDRDLFGPYFSRKQTHIHKLAMVLTAAETDARMIGVHNLVMAEKLVSSLEPGMAHVLGAISDSKESRHVASLCRLLLRNGKSASKQQVWRTLMVQMSLEDFHNSIRSAIAAGLVTEVGDGANVVLRPHLQDIAALYGGKVVQMPAHSESQPPADSDGGSAA